MPLEDFKWSKELTSELIMNYEMYPILYDPRHPDYIDRVKKSDAYEQLLKAMIWFEPSITLEIIKKKWHTLRGQFAKEFREVETSKKSGAGADDVFEPKLWCFDQLAFLKTHCKSRKSTCNIEKNNEECSSQSSPSIVESDLDGSELELNSTPKRKRKANTLPMENKIKDLRQMIQKKLESKSSYSWLGKQVVFELDSIQNETIRRKTSWAVQSILREGVEEDLQLRRDQTKQTSLTPQLSHFEEGSSSSSRQTPSSSSSLPSTSKDFFKNKAHIISVEEIRPASSQSDVARMSFTPDLLEQSMAGIFEDEDFD